MRVPDRAWRADLLVSGSTVVLATWWWQQFRLGGLLFGGLAGAVLLWRRRQPFAVLVAAALLCVAANLIEVRGSRMHEGMLLIVLAVATYAVVVYAERLSAALAGCLFGLLVAAALTESGFPRTVPTFGEVAEGAATLTGFAAMVWALGLSVRFYRHRAVSADRERDHLTRLAVADERAAIARELHDILAHSLSVIVLQANGAAYAFGHDPGRAREALRAIGATGAGALDEIRQFVQLLRGDGADAAGTNPGVPARIEEVVGRARAAGVAVRLVNEGEPPEVPGGVALAVHRIVQESLTNTLKHAGPAPGATVRMRYRPDAVEIDIVDSGAGPGAAVATGGHGLIGMRERASLYGGTFEAGPRPSGGWQVRVRIPVVAAERPVAG